ncbi:5,10-methylenetetrahydrofolate reductase [Jatrophihabitans endophyticus]|uniref:Methylenetetrahydrofolate reductase n=1 Tax=Jatrophihabitans endophyticus TaxID=1206085 RepID=A0A1M5E461_9ACTN|nr:methylenetetrahydrofolate reductase C-terminal domain-containing protein [Jatrophihabitans endophyticus]SHF74038.1 5,10-methylenetetrahydrofolate reductase [Jatrophihabitans endophyticus]
MLTGDTACPKRMVFGPCGGVRPDGACEMVAMPCVFPEPVLRPDRVAGVAPGTAPRVLADVSSPPFDVAGLRRVATLLRDSSDALLVGEHHNRPDFPPTVVARILQDEGCRPWITLACRDRNRVVLEQELRGLQLSGVDTVLCVTGDGRGPDVRPDVTQVWDLDGPRLAELAASLGLCAAVPETPTAPPIVGRPARLAAKERSGAGIAVLNHVREPGQVARFMAQAHAAGLTIPVVAAVAAFTDAESAAALQRLPGLELDPEVVAAVLASADPVAAGISAAVDEAAALLAIDGVVGVNVSGLASSRGWDHAAEVKAAIGARIKELVV